MLTFKACSANKPNIHIFSRKFYIKKCTQKKHLKITHWNEQTHTHTGQFRSHLRGFFLFIFGLLENHLLLAQKKYFRRREYVVMGLFYLLLFRICCWFFFFSRVDLLYFINPQSIFENVLYLNRSHTHTQNQVCVLKHIPEKYV